MHRLVAVSFLIAVAGCSARQWEVAAENQSDVPCAVFIELAGNSKVDVPKLGKEKATLIVGNRDTVVESVKVVREGAEKVLTPKSALPVGSKFLVLVTADGEVKTSTTAK